MVTLNCISIHNYTLCQSSTEWKHLLKKCNYYKQIIADMKGGVVALWNTKETEWPPIKANQITHSPVKSKFKKTTKKLSHHILADLCIAK